MTRRLRTLTVAGALAVVLGVLALFLPVPYVALGPGPADDTLGLDPGTRRPVLSITGAPTYPTSGRLLLTTVSVRDHLTLLTALTRWADSAYAVVPRTVVYPADQTQQQTDKQNQQDMALSQDSATTAALAELQVPQTIAVQSLTTGSKAAGVLRVGDVVTAVDGRAVPTLAALRAALASRAPGDVVQVGVRRGGSALTVPVTTSRADDGAGGKPRAILGITPKVTSTVSVTISLADVGGPSAGLMFALGIIDKLTPGPLTGGLVVAGTGTIDDAGTVGLIGGVQQKVRGAKARGATVFLTPEDNCGEARAAGVGGVLLVKVPKDGDGLAAARADVEKLARGDRSVPTC